jgi:hypothetical protein
MGAVMFGNGVSGCATNALGMLFLAILPNDLYKQALFFFISSALFLVLCSFSFPILMRNEFFIYYKELS